MLFPGAPGSPAERTRELVDEEARRIIDDCYGRALAMLNDNRDKLDALAECLLEKETLDEVEAYAAAGVSPARDALPTG